MSSRRVERLNEQLKREITEILRFEVKDPRVGPASVTAVRVTPDLSLARVFVLVTGEEEEEAQTLTGLQAAAPFIRTELGQRLRVRRVPELRFELDHSLEHAMRIERLLHEVLPQDEAEGTTPDAEPETGENSHDDQDEAQRKPDER